MVAHSDFPRNAAGVVVKVPAVGVAHGGCLSHLVASCIRKPDCLSLVQAATPLRPLVYAVAFLPTLVAVPIGNDYGDPVLSYFTSGDEDSRIAASRRRWRPRLGLGYKRHECGERRGRNQCSSFVHSGTPCCLGGSGSSRLGGPPFRPSVACWTRSVLRRAQRIENKPRCGFVRLRGLGCFVRLVGADEAAFSIVALVPKRP